LVLGKPIKQNTKSKVGDDAILIWYTFWTIIWKDVTETGSSRRNVFPIKKYITLDNFRKMYYCMTQNIFYWEDHLGQPAIFSWWRWWIMSPERWTFDFELKQPPQEKILSLLVSVKSSRLKIYFSYLVSVCLPFHILYSVSVEFTAERIGYIRDKRMTIFLNFSFMYRHMYERGNTEINLRFL
jgi:hypothetical protein